MLQVQSYNDASAHATKKYKYVRKRAMWIGDALNFFVQGKSLHLK